MPGSAPPLPDITRYLDHLAARGVAPAALAHLREQGEQVDGDAVVRLTPLLHKHINVLGRYRFNAESALLGERLRPLRRVIPGELDL